MELYVCYGTWTAGGHPCGKAMQALREAGYEPDVKRSGGWGAMPDVIFNQTPRRRRVKGLTGNSAVPTLILDDGTVIDGSEAIVDWARKHAVA